MTGKQLHDPGVLDREGVWRAIDAQRTRVADLLEELADDEWQQPSLCEGWAVRDVAAHLTLQEVGISGVIAVMALGRGNVQRGIHDAACRRAREWSTEQVIAAVRSGVGSRRHNAGVTVRETLIDALVHGQDIAVPLGRHLEVPVRATATAASRVWCMRWPPPVPAQEVVRGFRLTATDTEWSAGDGPDVHGPIGAILLVSVGRLVALPQLSGPGAPELAARLSSPRAA